MAEIINTINVEGEDYDVMPRIHAASGLEIVERCDWESSTFRKGLGVRLNEYGGLHIDVCDNSLGIKLSTRSIVNGSQVNGNPLFIDESYGRGVLTLRLGSGLDVTCDGTLFATNSDTGCGGGSSSGSFDDRIGACSEIGEFVRINNGVNVGCNTSIGYNSVICPEVELRPNVFIGGRTTIGCRTSIGGSVLITSNVGIDISCDNSLELKRYCDSVFTTNGALRIGDLDNNYLSIEYQGQKVKIKCEPQ